MILLYKESGLCVRLSLPGLAWWVLEKLTGKACKGCKASVLARRVGEYGAGELYLFSPYGQC